MSAKLFSRTLVPLDGSPHAEAILSHLCRFLPRHDAQLVLFHAVPPVPWVEETEIQKYLRKIAFRLANDGYPSTIVQRNGLPAEAILAAADQEQATMIALTTHGRTGTMRWVFGSVAERVLQASPHPVLVVRSFPSSQCRGKLESNPVRNFLVPLDGSRQSLGALDPVLKLARPVDAHVTLLHVDEPSPYDGRWESPDETLKEADRILREACIPSRVEHRKGHPGEEILGAAEAGHADLIAMTTHGRSGPSRWVFGSVAAQVLRAASVPLLVVRHAAPEKISRFQENSSASGSAPHASIPGTDLALHRP